METAGKQFWVKLSEDELRVAMLLLGQTKLDGVTEIREGYEPALPLMEEMLNKGFFRQQDTGRGWNPFVEAVLRCALYAQSHLRLASDDGTLCSLYFRYDNMVLLSKKPNEETMTFFFVPLLPEAIGSLARELKTEALADCAAVFDAIYNPAETQLLHEAKAYGAKTLNGLPMLVWQAAAAQEIWNGVRFTASEIDTVLRLTEKELLQR